MRPSWPDDPAWSTLAAQLGPTAPPPPLPLRAGAPGPWGWQLSGGALIVPAGLAGPAPHLPEDAAELGALGPLALDRWRRAHGSLIEVQALIDLCGGDLDEAEARQAEPLLRCAQVEAVERAAPGLGWGRSAAAALLRGPVHRWGESRGLAWAWATLHPGPARPQPDAGSWAALAAWVEDPARGPSAWIAAPVEPARGLALDLIDAAAADPWALVRVQLPPRPAGWRLEAPAGWAPPRRALDQRGGALLLARVDGPPKGSWAPQPAGPVGRWSLSSGSMGSVLGAGRGVELRLWPDGRAELIAADAWVGPASRPEVERAAGLGVTGSAEGRWWAEGEALRVSGLSDGRAGMHSRGGRALIVEDDPRLRIARSLIYHIEQASIRWARRGEGLSLRADVYGGALELRWDPA
ncbi:MAG: hypothetical protein JNM72_26100 [Deltaproteobacteria bacterium]|nr:hypothetical protein [Deltaproteobacteria bacterium]